MDSMIGRTVSAKRSASLGETARPLAEASRICRIAKPWAAGFAGGEGGLGAVAKKFNRSRCRPWGDRRELNRAVKFLRKGATLVITRIDRLARNTRTLVDIVDGLHGRG